MAFLNDQSWRVLKSYTSHILNLSSVKQILQTAVPADIFKIENIGQGNEL